MVAYEKKFYGVGKVCIDDGGLRERERCMCLERGLKKEIQ